jgi:hypothetical protein
MNYNFNKDYSHLFELLKDIVQSEFQQRNDALLAVYKSIETCINEYKIRLKEPKQYSETVKQELLFRSEIELLIAEFRKEYGNRIDVLNGEIAEIIKKECYSLNDPVIQEQVSDRFKLLKEDSIGLKFLKLWKILFFFISKWPLRFFNLFRIIFRKEKKPVKYWNHRVRRDLVLYSNVVSRVKKLLTELERNYINSVKQCISSLQNQVGHFDVKPSYFEIHEIDFNTIVTDLIKVIGSDFHKTKEENQSAFLTSIFKLGTIELPTWYYKWKTLRKSRKVDNQLAAVQAGTKKEWEKLLSNMQFQMRLSAIAAKISIPQNEFQNNFEVKVNNSIRPVIAELSQVVISLKDELKSIPENDLDLLKSYVVQGVYKMNKTLVPPINELSSLNFVQQIMNSSGHMEAKIQEITKNILENGEDQGKQPDQPYRNTLENIIKPYLVNTRFPDLQKEMTDLKLKFSASLEKFALLSNDLHHILDFCFDNALDIIENKDDKGADQDALEILHSGFENATSKVSALFEALDMIKEDFLRPTIKMVELYRNEIKNLHFEKNIQNIYLKVAKSRVLKRSNWVKDITTGFIKIHKKKSKALGLSIRTKASSIIGIIKKKLHLVPPSAAITSELSNFLNETSDIIKNLPLVYKRLFELKPIDETNLFIGREQEITMVENAYKDWQAGNYAATVVVGENGGGKSSLINYIINTVKFKYKVTKYHVGDFFSTEQDFHKLISDVLGADIASDDDLQNYFIEHKSRKIIIIDGMERLFLRKVNGIACLQRFLDLVAETNQQIFWIFVSAKYAWRYLSLVYHVEDYFDHKIEIKNFTPEEIQNVIFKRNRLSGYNVKYEISDQSVGKKISKLSEEAAQAELEVRYFNRLNQFAQSNLSLALSYWLVSIKKIDGNNLLITNFTAPEFSFLQNLSKEKAKTLLAVVLHGKINTAILAIAMNISEISAKRLLTILKEDGVLTFFNGFYYLHSILYRHIVGMLEARNLIH